MNRPRQTSARSGTVLLLILAACARSKAAGPSLPSNAPAENTPEVTEILEKHIEAIGGREAQLAIKSSESEYEFQLVDISQNNRVQGTIYEIREKDTGRFYSRTTDPHGTTELGFDGDRAWDRTPLHRGYLRKFDPQFRDLTQRRAEIHEYQETGQTFIRTRNEVVGGNDCIILRSQNRGVDMDGREKRFWVKYYFDPQTYLLHRIVVEADVRQVIDFDDFRKVDGTVVPFLKATKNPRVKLVWNLKSLKYNVPIDPERFQYESTPKTQSSK